MLQIGLANRPDRTISRQVPRRSADCRPIDGLTSLDPSCVPLQCCPYNLALGPIESEQYHV